ncbi:MAG: CHAT domain-containing protein, partial [Bacteroidota bacterium]
KIYSQLGNTADAVSLLTETYNNAMLYRLGQIAMTAALDLAKLHASLHHYERSSSAALNAYSLAKELQQNVAMIDALQLRMHAAAASGDADKAFEYYREGAALLGSVKSNSRPGFFTAAGRAFSAAGEWAFARSQFEKVIALSESHGPDIDAAAMLSARIGLGELYFHHFAFSEAQQQFVKAYNTPNISADPLTQSYLLIRIGDCLSRNSSVQGPRDGMIRAEQVYEQAMTIFIRNGSHLGEAVALHRLGKLKEMNSDDNGAITFYKRAFDKFNDTFVDPLLFAGSAEIAALIGPHSSSQSHSAIEWFSADLITELLRYKRYTEAYAYQQTVRTLSILSTIDALPIHFIDKQKERRYGSLHQSIVELRKNILEAYHTASGGASAKNKNYLAKLQQQIIYARSKVQSDAVTLAREYPSFSFLTASKRSVPETIISGLPEASAVIDYFIGNNQAWAFVLRPNEELTAVRISSFGYSLEAKMERFSEAVSQVGADSRSLSALSSELYEYLLKPLDRTETQRVIIIPPLSHDRFPFHALSNNGIPMIERTAVSYLPHISMLTSPPAAPKFINSVAAFGFTSNTRWGLEFELRDIRSFFRNIQVNNNQTATKERLESTVGEILQISSLFSADPDGNEWFALSDGSTSRSGVNFPVSDFTQLHPFQIVYLSDVRSDGNNISSLSPLLWLLNGSGSVIVNHYPVTSSVSKTFGENFYSSMSGETNPYLAYRRADVSVNRKKEVLQGLGGALYFYYGAK